MNKVRSRAATGGRGEEKLLLTPITLHAGVGSWFWGLGFERV